LAIKPVLFLSAVKPVLSAVKPVNGQEGRLQKPAILPHSAGNCQRRLALREYDHGQLQTDSSAKETCFIKPVVTRTFLRVFSQ
jgi:hypothetical protein